MRVTNGLLWMILGALYGITADIGAVGYHSDDPRFHLTYSILAVVAGAWGFFRIVAGELTTTRRSE